MRGVRASPNFERDTAEPTEEVASVVVAPSLSAQELIAEAGAVSFAEEQHLQVGALDEEAVERWLVRPPERVYLYAERPVETMMGAAVRGQCQEVRRWDSGVLNQLFVVIWRQGRYRTVLALGESVVVNDDERRDGDWGGGGLRSLPMEVVAWDDDHIRYAEGATRYVLACVPRVRTVPCDEEERFLGPRGYCLDERLVVRPWRMPFVPHVGAVSPGYNDPVPSVPEGDCAVQCERSDCRGALRLAPIPQAPLYEESAPALAVFRTRAACRDFASARQSDGRSAVDCDEDECW